MNERTESILEDILEELKEINKKDRVVDLSSEISSKGLVRQVREDDRPNLPSIVYVVSQLVLSKKISQNVAATPLDSGGRMSIFDRQVVTTEEDIYEVDIKGVYSTRTRANEAAATIKDAKVSEKGLDDEIISTVSAADPGLCRECHAEGKNSPVIVIEGRTGIRCADHQKKFFGELQALEAQYDGNDQ